MGWLARIVASCATVTIVGCAAIANLGDATTTDDQTDANAGSSGATTSGGTKLPGSSGSPGGDGGSSGTTDSGRPTSEGGADAGSMCSKAVKGAGCAAGTDCCSNACTTDRRCNDQCAGSGHNCNPLNNNECCVGTYCSFNAGALCTACRPNGMAAEVDATPLGNVIVKSSCCSGNVDPVSKNCAP